MAPKLDWRERWFLDRFPRLAFPDEPAAAERVREAARRAAAEEAVPDRASRSVVLYAAAVLQAYRELRDRGLPPPEARDRLVEPFREAAGGRWVGRGTRWMLRLLGPRRFVETLGGERAQRFYGGLFTFEEERSEGRHRQWVRRCGFHDYLRRHGAPELTPVFCAWDALWAEEVNRSGRGLRFARPQTLAEGAEACLFEFRFDEEP